MQKVGWLLPLVPKAVVLRAQRENLLRDAEMAELIQSVPARNGATPQTVGVAGRTPAQIVPI